MTDLSPYGIMAEFETPEQLMAAARNAVAAGYRKMDTFTPMPVHGLPEILGVRRAAVARIVRGLHRDEHHIGVRDHIGRRVGQLNRPTRDQVAESGFAVVSPGAEDLLHVGASDVVAEHVMPAVVLERQSAREAQASEANPAHSGHSMLLEA